MLFIVHFSLLFISLTNLHSNFLSLSPNAWYFTIVSQPIRLLSVRHLSTACTIPQSDCPDTAHRVRTFGSPVSPSPFPLFLLALPIHFTHTHAYLNFMPTFSLTHSCTLDTQTSSPSLHSTTQFVPISFIFYSLHLSSLLFLSPLHLHPFIPPNLNIPPTLFFNRALISTIAAQRQHIPQTTGHTYSCLPQSRFSLQG